jgi:hypothetical protein
MAAAPALALYVGLRFLGLYVLWYFASDAGADFWTLLTDGFDSARYRGVADRGYDEAIPVKPDGTLAVTNLAFFPLFPGLIAAITAISPLSSAAAGLLVSWLSGIAAAWGIYAVGTQLRDRTTGIILAGLWGALPHAIVQNYVYTESLFTALLAWSLLALLRRQWLVSSGLCLLAGLTRPTALALIAAVGIAALVAVFRREDGWRPWAAMLIAPLGYVGYLAWVGQRLGRLDGYWYLQSEAWNMRFDGGVDTVSRLARNLTQPVLLQEYVTTTILVLTVVLLALLVWDRYPLPLLVYTVVTIVVLLANQRGFAYMGRYLVPTFTLLLPIAVGLARARLRNAVAVLAVLGLISAWYGTYLSLVWTISP